MKNYQLNPVLKALGLAGLMLAVPSVQAAPAAGLMEIYRMAESHDTALAQAYAQFRSDEEGVKSAKGSLLPQISADGSYGITDSSIDAADVHATDLSLTLNQAIYQREAWTRYDQAKYVQQSSRYALQNTQQDLILRVTEAYFAVLLAQQNLALFKAKEEADKTQLESAEASAEVGLSSRVDVLQAKSSYDLSRSDRINAENSLDNSIEELAKLVGGDVPDLKSLDMQTALPQMDWNLSSLQQKAEQQNLSVKQAESQVRVAEQEVEAQKSGHWPTVSLQAKWNDSSYSDYQKPSSRYSDNSQTSIGVNVSMPIYSGGTVSSQVSSARYQSEVAKEALRESRDQARLNARLQARNLQRGVSLISALREAVKSNDAFLEAAEEGYKVGLNNLLEVLTARSNQYSARKNLLEAVHNQVLNQLRLDSIVGELDTDDLARFDALLQAPPIEN
ncbi:TolC family outer membrane protein [Thiomicrorhabdus sp.]|uniref:TolC family outer membrane protein n=1 Tax=Thiomicrorhabdus sp. TaxID=2039724 RepID=UPI0029C6FFD9|nr:TolC family outer membrane protein [Thiomicrorhabdus sp.]